MQKEMAIKLLKNKIKVFTYHLKRGRKLKD